MSRQSSQLVPVQKLKPLWQDKHQLPILIKCFAQLVSCLVDKPNGDVIED
jgi:hypothetical protein